jgi:hypothetical protein
MLDDVAVQKAELAAMTFGFWRWMVKELVEFGEVVMARQASMLFVAEIVS